MQEKLLNGLTDEQIVKEENELTDEQLEAVAGGLTDEERRKIYKQLHCSNCGASSSNLKSLGFGYTTMGLTETIQCKKCGHSFKIPYPG